MQKQKVCRDKDLGATGHGCTTVIGVKSTQDTVFANNTPVLRLGDPSLPHVIKVGVKCVGHGARINQASKTVFVRGIGIGRVGDSHDGSIMITGSANVFAGG